MPRAIHVFMILGALSSCAGKCERGAVNDNLGGEDGGASDADGGLGSTDGGATGSQVGFTIWTDPSQYEGSTPLGIMELVDRWGVTGLYVWAENAEYFADRVLPKLGDTGLTFYVLISGRHSNYEDSGGFSIEMWKEFIAHGNSSRGPGWLGDDGAGGTWKDHLQPYVDSGQARIMLLDDITNFDGHNPTGVELDEMAKYLDDMWPGIYVMVRKQPAEIPKPWPDGDKYSYLDAAASMYYATDGDVGDWVEDESAAYAQTGLDAIYVLSVSTGGDGSSDTHVWGSSYWAMTAEEVRRNGDAFLTDSGIDEISMWEYDAEGETGPYMDRPDISEAIKYLGDCCAARVASP